MTHDSLEKLVKGVHAFQRGVFGTQRDLFANLEQGQSPSTLFITCSDSRVVPSLITQVDPGELFVLRNAGNMTPPYGAGSSGSAATVEYAVACLKVTEIVVCGHSHCGAVKAALNPESVKGLTALERWLGYAESTRRIIQENYRHITDPADLLTAAIEENVLVQVENLRTHPSVAAALARGALRLHAWVYRFETGAVFAYDPEVGQFLPITASESSGAPGASPAPCNETGF